MADHFADRYWATKFWTAKYFQGGEQNPGAMYASLSGSGVIAADIEGITVESAVVLGGAWVPEKARKAEQRRKKRLEDEERELESTIRLAYQRLTGKITTPPAIFEAEGSPQKLAVNAEKLAAQLVSKSRNSEKMRARNAEIIKDLLYQANEITRLAEAEADEMQMEEEAIVMLLAL